MTSFELDVDTAGTPVSPGVRDMTVTDRWNTPNGTPNGGYLLALALRGVVEEVGPSVPDPVVAAATFFRPAVPGPARLETTVLNAGRRLTTAQAGLTQGDRPVLQMVATLADRAAADGPTRELGSPPDLPPVEDCRDPGLGVGDGPRGPMTIVERNDYRLAAVPGWARGEPSGDPSAAYWVRPADGRPVDRLALAFLVDAWPPAISELGLPNAVTVQLTVHLHRVPTTEWVACQVRTRHLVDGYHEEDMDLWDAGGHLLAQSRQLALVI